MANNPLFTSLHTLLMAIYRRDCRRSFCPDGHWLAKVSRQDSRYYRRFLFVSHGEKKNTKMMRNNFFNKKKKKQEVRVSGFLTDLEKGKRGAALLLAKMPHVIPHSERVVLFRKHIADEKAVMGLTESVCNGPSSTLIAVHRYKKILWLIFHHTSRYTACVLLPL